MQPRQHNSERKELLPQRIPKSRNALGGLSKVRHLFSINAEGGPLLCLDAQAAIGWKGYECGGADYENLCSRFDAQPELEAIVFTVSQHSVIAWEMSGPGTAEVFRSADGHIHIVRAWTDDDAHDAVGLLASVESFSHVDVGEIEVPSGLLVVLWSPESGQRILLATERDVQPVTGTSLDGSAFVVKVTSRRYRCRHDEVRVGAVLARRLTLIPG